MSAGYSIHALATADLENIWFYTVEEWGLEQADIYLHSLLSRFSWLSENPLLGKRRDDIKPGYYCYPVGMHLIFYLIKENGIEIIGIPHQRMDIVDYFEAWDE